MSLQPAETTGLQQANNPGRLRRAWAAWRHWTQRQINERDEIGNALDDVSPGELQDGIKELARTLHSTQLSELDRASKVAQNNAFYYVSAQEEPTNESLPVNLEQDERASLQAEREDLLSQKGMLVVIYTVSLAAFLQGHVQSFINAGDLYAKPNMTWDDVERKANITWDPLYIRANDTDWHLGGMNAIPFFSASLFGAPLSLPINYCVGRRGALALSALLIIASSLGSAFSRTWVQLLGVRIVAGVAMGIKAVSAPILASETAVGFWRGSIMLAWQLWVACGIMIGFVVNIIIAASAGDLEAGAEKKPISLSLILGAPLVPAVFLLISVCFCYESPRFYMRPNTPNFNLDRALRILLKVRQTRLQALRDLILIWWPNKDEDNNYGRMDPGLTYAARAVAVLKLSLNQYNTLFRTRRLRNAIWSTCTVALAQQLCGINVFAFYSNKIFYGTNSNLTASMAYSLGFGAVNFLFGLLAMRSIDTIGRRRWLLSTLPLMSLFLMASAVSFDDANSQTSSSRNIVGTVFIYLFAAAYSPGLGPIPFTLASESFPLSHREAGASVAISINLFFAGLLSILLPTIHDTFKTRGTLGCFAVLNVVAFVLVAFLIKETRRLTLEELDHVYDKPKREFARYQLRQNLPYFINNYAFWWREAERPASFDVYAMETQD